MINEYNAKKFCCEDISKIENYEKAVSDTTTTWHCHHRLGSSMTSSGRPFYTAEELILNNKYFNRPANELVFLTPHDHHCAHRLLPKKKKLKHKDILKIASSCIAAGYSESQTLEIISQLQN